jgi:hypothetical protein
MWRWHTNATPGLHPPCYLHSSNTQQNSIGLLSTLTCYCSGCVLQVIFLGSNAATATSSSAAAAAGRGGHGAIAKPVKIHQSSTAALATAAAAAATAAASAPQFPKDPIYSNPWVQQHIALTYAPETTRDGLGAQAFRMLGIYALSKALGVKYLHTQPECIGHIGGLPHYQGQDCSSRLTAADYKTLDRVQRVLVLPSSQGLKVKVFNSSSSNSSSSSRLEADAVGPMAMPAVAGSALEEAFMLMGYSSSSSSNSSSGGGGGWHVERLDDVC